MRKNKIVAGICIGVMLFTLVLPGFTLASDTTKEAPVQSQNAAPTTSNDDFTNMIYARVATPQGSLNMREEPKAKGKKLATIPKGAAVQVLGKVDDEWTEILYKKEKGYVMSKFLEAVPELNTSFTPIKKGDRSKDIMAIKEKLQKLGYIKAENVNQSFDNHLQIALTKLQLVNELPLSPQVITPQVQALLEQNLVEKGKSGYSDIVVDEESGLTAAIFCWDMGGRRYEADQAVKVKIHYAAAASGGQEPYTITVKKSLTPPERGGVKYSDDVKNPFYQIWSKDTQRLYVYAVVEDTAGNTVTACAPFNFTLPDYYLGEG